MSLKSNLIGRKLENVERRSDEPIDAFDGLDAAAGADGGAV